ncbi:MAG: ABC-2 transporter permease [Clostridia bacterium]|nr:ABC-2 transporter permease [Clostridia bacterium]
MLSIYKKELRNYFTTITGYGFLGFLVLITGYFFISQNIISRNANYNDALAGSMIMFLILIPVLTMRLFAEESRQKTDQLLFSAPIKVPDIVGGKFLSALTLYFIGIAITLIFPFMLSRLGEPDWGTTIVGLLGYFMMGGCLISVGLFISVLTDNQIVAAAATFAAVFLLLMMDNISSSAPITVASSIIFIVVIILALALLIYSSTKNFPLAGIFSLMCFVATGVFYLFKPNLFDGVIVSVLGWFSVLNRFENFYMGIISISDIIYYITFSIAFLYLTVNVIEKRRWS